MRKRTGILTILTAVLLMFTGISAFGLPLAAPDKAERAVVTSEDADEWIRVLLGDHPEELDGQWKLTDQMKAAVTMSGGMKGIADSLAALGTIETIGSAYQGEVQGLQAFFIPCVFSAASVDLILVTDQGAVAGLTTGPYTNVPENEEQAEGFETVELAVPVPELNGELPGTLTLPEGEGPFPAVVLVHGSGPSDRDETIMNLKPFRDLAEGLAREGIAVYRYDKRTYVYGAQLANDIQATLMDETVEDAAMAVQILAQQEKIDPSRIFVLGHSLGGNAVPAIDRALKEQTVSACGYILLAASPRPLEELMRQQYDYLYSLMPEVTQEQQEEKDALFKELDRLQDLDLLANEEMIAGAYASYWKWLADYDVLHMAEEMEKPCLLLQGEEDYQVTMEDFGIWQEALKDKANWQLISYPGLTHLFTAGEKAEGPEAYLRTEKVDDKVIRDIAGFIGQ